MPSRRATSPSKCLASIRSARTVGSDSSYVPVAGMRWASGNEAPVSSRRISLDEALTFVTM